MGDMQTRRDRINFIKGRSKADSLQKAISNGFLFLFITEGHWGLMLAFFLLSYLSSRAAVLQSQSIQHKMERDRFEQMAYTDFLTKLHNRTYMNKVMNELNSSDETIGIVVCDIDNFKQINDTYNHTVGDSVIQHFAKLLKSSLGENDYLFRSGGEEFTIILRNRPFNECETLIKSIQHETEQLQIVTKYRLEDISIGCTASFGMYYFTTSRRMDIKQGYIQADDLLYRAKELGKNQVISKNGLRNKPPSE